MSLSVGAARTVRRRPSAVHTGGAYVGRTNAGRFGDAALITRAAVEDPPLGAPVGRGAGGAREDEQVTLGRDRGGREVRQRGPREPPHRAPARRDAVDADALGVRALEEDLPPAVGPG